jgi:DNA polymerase (family X)
MGLALGYAVSMPDYDNHSVAAILDRMADLMELAGEDKFRFLAYRKAAHALRGWPHPVADAVIAGSLTDIPGVGAKMAAHIDAVFESGTFPEYEAFAARFPAGLTEVMSVSGVGPKRAAQLHASLGVSSLDDLEAALADGKVAQLRGFGAKSAQVIMAGIQAYRRHHERILLSEAVPLAERLVSEIRATGTVTCAEPAGSLRRRKETIGDIDIVTAGEDPAAVMEAVRSLPSVTRVVSMGETKTSVMTTAGLQVDIRVVAPDQYGAALQYFTGSKEHNVHVREIAKRAGFKVNEYGVFRLADDVRVAGETEEDVYAALGLDTAPPEIREDAGEIEAAIGHELPRLLELSDLRGDLQTHSTWTDGRTTLTQNRALAAELGYEYFAATDHARPGLPMTGMDEEGFERQWEEIDELNADGSGLPRILKGVELNIAEDGSLGFSHGFLARFDLVLASLHSGWGRPESEGTARMLAAVEDPWVDVIAHPTGRVLGRRDAVAFDVEMVFEAAGRTGTVLEVDAYPDRLDLCDVHLRMARRHGVSFAVSTDAHAADQLRYIGFGVSTARRGWVVPAEVVNAQPLDAMLGRLKRNRA